ncbi:hypothetical protein AB0E27_32165 [Streptomyces sparsogenes]|uniref:hypothetical protein n=1 Tax=Streptomyces sparsogenes TaxID=67365 RepID=UPI0033EBA078
MTLDLSAGPPLAVNILPAQSLLPAFGGLGIAVVLFGSPRLRTGADRARVVINPMAGALGVPPRTFALWQTVGGLLRARAPRRKEARR